MSARGKADRYFNRELSWLEFDGRVLEEACDPTVPLFERLKFATIAASNLDEFFMVRVAWLKRRIGEGITERDPTGLLPHEQFEQVAARAHALVAALQAALGEGILPALAQHGVRIARPDALDDAGRAFISRLFRDQVAPALTPLAIGAERPFPLLAGLSLNLAVRLDPAPGEEQPRLAIVQLPAAIPKLVRVAGAGGSVWVLLEEVVRTGLGALFPGQPLAASAVFRVTRDSELELDDEGGATFLESIREELRGRRRSDVVRLEIEAGADPALQAMLVERLDLLPEDLYESPPPVDLRALAGLLDLPGPADLRDPPQRPLSLPILDGDPDLFEVLEGQDLVLHHPYDAFDPVVALLTRAADDPDVLAIKQTLYRTSGDSSVIRALARAADRGKQVTVLVELLARFDEWSNIRWARELERAGAHVLYGVRGYKTHAKALIVVRRTADGIRRFVHLATGNYNDRTARHYTDFGVMTADPQIGADVAAFFNALTGFSDPPEMKKLAMAPTRLRQRLLALIERERRRAEAGQAAGIDAKMNALVDQEIIEALYAASAAGVRIRLNVRGICCLRPGVRGLSERIEVVSIVDRYLEHSRIFWFRNGGDEEVYLSSADWMPRNLDRRIELMFPVESEAGRLKVRAALDAMFRDNVKARRLAADGTWRRARPGRGEEPHRAQVELHRAAEEEIRRARRAAGVVLDPIRLPDGESA
jgi:polyphosphate kinase